MIRFKRTNYFVRRRWWGDLGLKGSSKTILGGAFFCSLHSICFYPNIIIFSPILLDV
jgi:hypothetical protein